MAKNKAVILAGGLGTRLRPLTLTTPKCLVPIGDKSLLDYWLENLAQADVHEALINNHHLPEVVRAKIQAVNASGPVKLTEFHEPELLGSAGTLTANRAFADDADIILIIYADNLSSASMAELLAFHQSHDDPFTMLLFTTPRPKTCGIAVLDDEKRVVEFVEKPENPKSDLANAGVYAVDAACFREIADMKGFDIGFDILPKLVGRMRGFAFEGYHRDIGNMESLEQARADIAAGRVFS